MSVLFTRFVGQTFFANQIKMKRTDKENATLTNAQATSATSARTTEPAVTTYRNALDATGINIVGLMANYLPADDDNKEWHNLLGYLSENYDLIDEEGYPIDFFSAYVTDATAEQAQQLRNTYEGIYIAYSATLDKYVLLTTWYGTSMEYIPVTVRNSTQVA